MVIQHIFDTITLILNKNRKGFVKTSQINTAVRSAMFDFFLQEVEIYRKTGVINASVKPMVKTTNIILTSGLGNLPPDFSQEVSFETSCGKEGTLLSPEEYMDRKNSAILAPDQENPILKIENKKVYIQPDEFIAIDLVHFREPAEFVYDTTVALDGRSVSFNEAGSTDIEFGYEESGEIIKRALVYLGIAFQNNEAFQLGISSISNDNAQ
jgi:hypothetical protein